MARLESETPNATESLADRPVLACRNRATLAAGLQGDLSPTFNRQTSRPGHCCGVKAKAAFDLRPGPRAFTNPIGPRCFVAMAITVAHAHSWLLGLIGVAMCVDLDKPNWRKRFRFILISQAKSRLISNRDGRFRLYQAGRHDSDVDQVKLHTVILVPKGARQAPMLLTRTPYNATELTSHAESAHLGPILQGYDNATEVIVEGGYIRVVQDIRGKHGSEGDYVMNRPLHGPQNPTPVDHATDTYDTIEWLVKNVPESNGRVGIIGISYDGFLPLMALVNPHPALKVSVPMNPMVDGWMGDDWFHHGAFRQQNMVYIYQQEGTRKTEAKMVTSHYDDYDMFIRAVSAENWPQARAGAGWFLAQNPGPSFLRCLLARTSCRSDPGSATPTVPVLLVHGLWDQEDIYGALAVYKAIKPKDVNNDKVSLVLGP
ncbi:MAG: CocE/NonD family hydrolase [Verrucomicrobiota bacterium]